MSKCLLATVVCLLTTAAFAQRVPRGAGPGGLDGPGGNLGPAQVQDEIVSGQPVGGRRGGPGQQGGNRAALPGQMGAQMGAMIGPAMNPMFAVIDSNADGVITPQELRRAVAALRTLDADRDGNITLAEAAPQFTPGDPAQMIEQTFAQYDRNGDALLTADEVPAPMARTMRGWDQNGDGAVSREELAASMPNMVNVLGGPGQRGGINQQQIPQQMVGRMMQYDRNGDGRLTPDEVPQQMMGMLQGADRNGDGALDPQELQATARAIEPQMRRGLGAGGELGQDMDPGRGTRRGGRGDQ